MVSISKEKSVQTITEEESTVTSFNQKFFNLHFQNRRGDSSKRKTVHTKLPSKFSNNIQENPSILDSKNIL